MLMFKHNFRFSLSVYELTMGGGFIGHELASFLATNGVTHQTTCPYTPQQNGRV